MVNSVNGAGFVTGPDELGLEGNPGSESISCQIDVVLLLKNSNY